MGLPRCPSSGGSSILLWVLFFNAVLAEESSSLIPTCPSTVWSCSLQSGYWRAGAQSGPLENLTLVHRIQDDPGGPIEVVDVRCDQMTVPMVYSKAMFQPFHFPPKVSYFKFQRCSMPDIPFRSILEPYTDRISVIRFSSEDSLPTFNWTLFTGLPSLRSLLMMSNGISQVPEHLFSGILGNLTAFSLNSNSISHLPKNLFHGMTNLTKLELGANQLTIIQKELFQGLTNLEFLALYNNNIIEIEPGAFDDLKSLKGLNLQGNRLKHLPASMLTNFTRLWYVNLFTNNLRDLPEDLFSSCPKLEDVRINDNPQLTSVPEKLFQGLSNLSYLDLSGCAIRQLPPNLFKGLSNLTTLKLHRNNLTELSADVFTDNAKLESISLNGNRLRSLSRDAFFTLRDLKVLSLDDNLLEEIPDSCFLNIRKLGTLTLARNRLREIPFDLLAFTTQMTKLDLSDNQITYSYENDTHGTGPFFMPRDILQVNLRGNRFRDIPLPFLLPTVRLQSLDFSFNEMAAFDSENFQVVADGVVVNLTGNPITSIVFDMDLLMATRLKYTPKDRNSLVFGSNPLFCDCHLRDFVSYIQGQQDLTYPFKVDTKSLTCSGPPPLTSTPFSSVTIDRLTCPITSCPTGCTCLLWALGNITETICSGGGFRAIPWPVPINTTVLRVDHNPLGSLDSLPMDHWANLTEIYLNDANLTRVGFKVLPPNLTKLELHGNGLSLLSSELMSNIESHGSLVEVTLRDNPWSCECDEQSQAFKDWLGVNARKVPNMASVKCRNGGREAGVPVQRSATCPKSLDLAIIISCVVLAVAAMCAFLAVLYYRHGRSIKVWMYAHQMCLWFVTEKDLDSDKTYDGFVSFSQEDADFVANYLLPGLEQGVPRYRLCIHYRDWLAGEWIPDQIIRSVNESKRTIVVLSKHFIQSVWGRLEFRTAYHQALQDRTNRIIVVVVGEVPPESEMDPELRTYVKLNTYVKWGDPWFWKKLRYSMPHHTCYGPSTISSSHNDCVPTLSAISTASTTLSDWTPLPINHTGDKMELVISQLGQIVNGKKGSSPVTNIA